MPATTRTDAAPTLPPYPSWARAVSADPADRDGAMNVGALRARTAQASSVAPFDVEVELADGTRVSAPLVAVDVTPTRMLLRVRLPKVAVPAAG